MKTIWKYELDRMAKSQGVQMPCDSNILDVQLQDGIPVFWALVDTDTPMRERRFLLLLTGEEVPGDPTYIGTFQIGLIREYHLFEEFDDELPF